MKKSVVFIICMILCALLMVFSKTSAEAAREGFSLWAEVLLPSLLPFFVCCRIMQQAGFSENPIVFYMLSFISGAPSGARLCGINTGSDMTRRIAALNNIGPAFVCGAYASVLLRSSSAAWPLIIAQLTSSALFYYAAIRREKDIGFAAVNNSITLSTVADAITEGITALMSICGTVIVFSVFISLMHTMGALGAAAFPFRLIFRVFGGNENQAEAFVCALLEAASGSVKLAHSGIPGRVLIALSAFVFSFGGISVLAQSLLFTKLRPGRYLLFKLLQGIVSAFIAYMLCPLFPGCAVNASASLDQILENAASAGAVFVMAIYAMSITMLLCLVVKNRRRMNSIK